MSLQAVPDDQQRLLQVGVQRLEELDVLLLLDRALVQTERKRSMNPVLERAPVP
jgi:hypothetical protein